MVQARVAQKLVNITFYKFFDVLLNRFNGGIGTNMRKAQGRPPLRRHVFIKSTPLALEGRAAPPPC
jgi:hypothetical protein